MSVRQARLSLLAVLLLTGLFVAGCDRDDEAVAPSLFGLTQSEAEDLLEEGGLELGDVVYQPGFQLQVAEGTVVGQAPAGGTALEEGAEVDVILAGEEALLTPEVVGKTESEAIDILQDAGLKVGEVSQVGSGEVEAGRVVSQKPAAGQGVPLGAKINLEVSRGVTVVKVPDVVGQTREDAQKTLEETGLEVGVLETFSDSAAGQVVEQAPEAGSSLNAGAKVTIVVSTGPLPVAQVPDVQGQGQSAATQALQAAGFEVRVGQAYSNAVSSGLVAAQSPPTGVYAAVGSPVEITVSQGPPPPDSVTIPDVTGRPQQEASQTLSDAGLGVETLEAYSETVPAGSVIGQAPSAGLQTAPGATVTIAVSQGAPPAAELPPAGEAS